MVRVEACSSSPHSDARDCSSTSARRIRRTPRTRGADERGSEVLSSSRRPALRPIPRPTMGRLRSACLQHYRELLEAAQAGGYRFAFFEDAPRGRGSDPAPRRRPLARRGAPAGRARGRGRRPRDVLPDDRARSSTTSPRTRASARSSGSASSATASACTRSTRALSSTSGSTTSSPGTTPIRSTCARRSRARST